MVAKVPLLARIGGGGNAYWLRPGDTLQVNAARADGASINVPHGAAPTAPVDGDVWTTTAGIYVRINGVTVGPLGAGGGGAGLWFGTSAPSSPATYPFWWKSDEGKLKVYYTDADSSQWVDATPTMPGPTGATGATGAAGSTGAQPWVTPPTAWVTATSYTATAPASVVTQGGSSYVCATSHTSGTFATDLTAGKWTLIASKGDAGAAGSSGSLGPNWTTLSFGSSESRYGATVYPSTATVTVASGQRLEVEAYLYKSAAGNDAAVVAGIDGTNAYLLKSQGGDGNVVVYRNNGGSGTALGANGSDTVNTYQGMHYIRLIINVLSTPSNKIYVEFNDRRIPLKGADAVPGTDLFYVDTNFTMVGNVKVWVQTDDITKAYVRARAVG